MTSRSALLLVVLAGSLALPLGAAPADPKTTDSKQAAPKPAAPAVDEGRLSERAHQDRTIVYFLRQPDTHTFDLYHDYTEARPGIDRYVNVVRPGSTASNPSARDLDHGVVLSVESLSGDAAVAAGAAEHEKVEPGGEVVIAHFPPVGKGESLRLRISESYTDPKSYRLDGNELVFDRSLGRPRNAVVLPAGWMLTVLTIPATVSELPDGRIRLDFENDRPDEIGVLIKAQRRPTNERH
jgi:hypothetical protein